jgi:serine/threonine protein kinase
MSPEQVRGQPVDHRSDVFSLGIVLYEMVSGRRPFQGDSAIETLNAILKDDPPGLCHEKKQTIAEIERVTRRCLQKNPDARFQSASDLAFNLELVLLALRWNHDWRRPATGRDKQGRLLPTLHWFL